MATKTSTAPAEPGVHPVRYLAVWPCVAARLDDGRYATAYVGQWLPSNVDRDRAAALLADGAIAAASSI